MTAEIAISTLYAIAGIIDMILYIGVIPTIIYAFYLLRKIANK
ncbi:hypothetical protein GGGNBK_19400 [Sporosarcina sp. ANT_H38]|nr:hypothetical protein [Sporosarcina sp. ANT_H38]